MDLRYVMKRSGVKDEKITFIFDESNALGPAFLERMNALLAGGEVPGLFEWEEYSNLISECRSNMRGVQMMDDAEVFWKFTKTVMRNLHIVFTMNPWNPDFYNRGWSSPALFNRCIIDWFGDWPREWLQQVAYEFTSSLAIEPDSFSGNADISVKDDENARHFIMWEWIVNFHEKIELWNDELKKWTKKYNFVAPRDFLDFINHFIKLVNVKKWAIINNKEHLAGGLNKLKETEHQVWTLKEGLK